MSFGNLECTQQRPFHLRKERRALYRQWKKFITSKATKREAGLQSNRKYYAALMEGYDDSFILEGLGGCTHNAADLCDCPN